MRQPGSPAGRAVELEIDVAAVIHNANAVRDALAPGTRLYACLKGDAYGCGIRHVAPALAASGVDAFAVGSLEDALEIRKSARMSEILLYPNCLPDAAPAVERERLTVTLSSIDEAVAWNAAASGTISAFIKIDVGALRAGVLPREVAALGNALRDLRRLRIAGAYAHLHLPDPSQMRSYGEWQFGNFKQAVAALREGGVETLVQMVSGTAAVLAFPYMDLDAVDPGRALFGLGFTGVKRPLDLWPALVGLRTRLLLAKDVHGADVGEFAPPFALRPGQRVGVIPVGWGDGLPRRLPESAIVLVRGRRVRLLAPSHFEHVRVDLTDAPDARYGDEVVLLGSQHDERIELIELSGWMGRDPLHLLGAMPRHLARIVRRRRPRSSSTHCTEEEIPE